MISLHSIPNEDTIISDHLKQIMIGLKVSYPEMKFKIIKNHLWFLISDRDGYDWSQLPERIEEFYVEVSRFTGLQFNPSWVVSE